MRVDILYFLDYEVDEELPWHLTVSRTRQQFLAAVFERLFDHVFAQCVARGLVAGDTQAVDSAPVKANASLDSVQRHPGAGKRGMENKPHHYFISGNAKRSVNSPALQKTLVAVANVSRSFGKRLWLAL
jgi:hypothetical protein